MYIDMFAKNEKEYETLIQTIRIYSQYIGMEFGIEKCAMFIMKCEKTNNGRNRIAKSINNWKKGKLQILGDIESRYHQTNGDERKNLIKEYLRQMRKLLENKLCRRNLIQGIKTWAVLYVRYS